QHDCRRIQALLAEMPRDGLGDGRGGAGPDLRNMERDREAITGRLGARLLTWHTYHVQRHHVSSSCGSVTIVSTTPPAGPSVRRGVQKKAACPCCVAVTASGRRTTACDKRQGSLRALHRMTRRHVIGIARQHEQL